MTAAVVPLAVIVVALLLRVARVWLQRGWRSRVADVRLDSQARRFVADAATRGRLRIVASTPAPGGRRYDRHLERHRLTDGDPILFLEVAPLADATSADLTVQGQIRQGQRVLRVCAPQAATTIVAVLLHIRDRTGLLPRAYFLWSDSHPLERLVRFLLLGDGAVTLVTRILLQRAEPDPLCRPTVHVS